MASKQSKQKAQPKAKGRSKAVKVSDLQVRKGGAIKGGSGDDRPTESLSLNFTKVKF